MSTFIVAGCGTDVGKTLVSAMLVSALQADYWKPIQSGAPSDVDMIRSYVPKCCIHKPLYSLKAPVSPHHAARLENIELKLDKVLRPQTKNTLVIEMAGGVLVPLNQKYLGIDFFMRFNARWIVVSRHYLGSINHTLLTLEALKMRGVQPEIVFNGPSNPDTEEAIVHHSGCKVLAWIDQYPEINSDVIRRCACQHFGSPLLKC